MTRASEWATRVAAWRASGKTAKEFCKGRDYGAGLLASTIALSAIFAIAAENK